MAATGSSLRTHCLSPSRARPPVDAAIGPARYARMFPDLPAFEADEAFLHAMGRAGGLCDCGDEADTPGSLSTVAAGWPIFGQFVAHDITADRSALRGHVDARELRNARAPQLNLECLYGDGPVGHPFLFQRDDPAKFLLGVDGADIPRNAEGIAIIGDPRNDSHMLMAQMHLAMLKAHNAFADEARRDGLTEHDVFDAAARETRWHYQRAILEEFLPSLVGRALIDEVTTEGPRWFRPDGDVFIPLEFADAAYRYGHCQIRHTYQLNQVTAPVPIFPDLLGFRAVPRERTVDWTLFFDEPRRERAQRAKKIDGRLAPSLIHLPVAITGECEIDEYHSLAVRDLQRGQGVGLPSGEAVARRLGVTPLTSDEVGLRAAGWTRETPLWYYILREAAVTAAGDRLGPVGGRIVADVIVWLLDRDPASVRFANPEWRPRRSLFDLLQAGVPASAA
ncbi:MAG: peroxidase [Acidobacteria bacterium]|nr:MAG: peroxidase [Acidobacteriota bacterium]